MALAPVLERLRGCRVVLASASPRRRDILGYTGLAFEATPSGFPETLRRADFRDPREYAAATAEGKARAAARALGKPLQQPVVVIAADTVVALDGRILEKPRDADDAERMLRSLSGRQHRVITGVAVLLLRPGRDPGDPSADPGADPADPAPAPEVRTFCEETRVTFADLPDALVREHVASGDAMDKAGGYGIQGRGAMLVRRVDGDLLNAAGLPLLRLCRELAAMLPGPGADVTPPATPDLPATSVTPGGGPTGQ